MAYDSLVGLLRKELVSEEYKVNKPPEEVMSLEELQAHILVLEDHVARLEGIIHVMLEQAENGTLQEMAAEIRAELQG